ncbi:probable chitinase 2 [Schistocerca gregaria]|uniref:probable chitinase 2 n=1 Tax=Schistocerca gregaria TaxID=7010 RepID=UPI00211E236C|nr:probable chitinase 2 [Schistocerca gregaria]
MQQLAPLAFVLAFLAAAFAASPLGHNKAVVCYVSSWAVYRPGNGVFTVSDINPNICSHLVYAFAGLNATDNTIITLDKYNDLEEDYGKGNYKKITGLKNQYPHLKVSIAIGGWNEGSANYSHMASTPTTRQQFIRSVVNFLRKYNFDGLDLDWEYPTQRGGVPSDRENFVALVRELRQEFDKNGWLLTAALGASTAVIEKAYDVPMLGKYLDYMHIMCYDYHGTWDKMTGANAPLYGSSPSDTLSVDNSIRYYLKLGAPAKKLLMGVPLYGRTFMSDANANMGGLGAPAEEKSFQGPYTKEDGYMGYNEICLELKTNSSMWTIMWDDKSSTPYAVSTNKVIVYDNAKSLTEKVNLAMKLELGGIMVWPLDTDDFRGECSEGIYPLMHTINKAIVQSSQQKSDSSGMKVPDSTAAASCGCASLIFLSFLYLFQL